MDCGITALHSHAPQVKLRADGRKHSCSYLPTYSLGQSKRSTSLSDFGNQQTSATVPSQSSLPTRPRTAGGHEPDQLSKAWACWRTLASCNCLCICHKFQLTELTLVSSCCRDHVQNLVPRYLLVWSRMSSDKPVDTHEMISSMQGLQLTIVQR